MGRRRAPALQAGQAVMPMVLIGFVLVVTFVFIAFDWLHKTIAALLGAIVAVALDVFGGEKPYLRVHDFVHHDLGVIGVIIGTSIVVAIASESGLFHFIAIRLVKLTVASPVQAIADAANSADALLVLASSPDPRSVAQMRTAALVRVSRNPLLVVR